jgi:hypothetical protein
VHDRGDECQAAGGPVTCRIWMRTNFALRAVPGHHLLTAVRAKRAQAVKTDLRRENANGQARRSMGRSTSQLRNDASKLARP